MFQQTLLVFTAATCRRSVAGRHHSRKGCRDNDAHRASGRAGSGQAGGHLPRSGNPTLTAEPGHVAKVGRSGRSTRPQQGDAEQVNVCHAHHSLPTRAAHLSEPSSRLSPSSGRWVHGTSGTPSPASQRNQRQQVHVCWQPHHPEVCCHFKQQIWKSNST